MPFPFLRLYDEEQKFGTDGTRLASTSVPFSQSSIVMWPELY